MQQQQILTLSDMDLGQRTASAILYFVAEKKQEYAAAANFSEKKELKFSQL
jgi:hypothetical protein